MPLAEHHDMVEAFSTNRANHPLRIAVLPRRAWRYNHLSDVEHPGSTRKSFAIDRVAIPDQKPRALLQPARLEQLPRRPFRGRLPRDPQLPPPAPPPPPPHHPPPPPTR